MDLPSIYNLPTHPQPSTAEQPLSSAIPPAPAAGKRGRGRPKKQLPPPKVDGGEAALPPGISAADATLVSLGLVEESLPVTAEVLPGKKGRGRPKKNGPANGLGKPAGSRSGKRGRPKKSAAAENGAVESAARGVKRGRGRPKRISEGNGAADGAVQGLVVKKLGRGRPRVKSTEVKAVGYSGRKRGRPRKVENAGGGGGGALVVAGKKRGRPPGRKNSGRPVGRPRKNPHVGSSRPLAFGTFTEEDVLRKFEYVQMKIKDAVGTLRPQCGDSITAADAIQELEGLSSMDFSMVPLATVAEEPPAAAAAAPPAN